MEPDEKLDPKNDLFVRYAKDIKPAYDRAVREALLMHKRAGNPVPVERDGKLVILQPDDIPVD
ncbi:MAG: hypothetical protein AB7F88_02605 [Pyrinomonadaceae bacterium]